ncbi:S41 family peptidase [Rhodanobacter sp. DHG33]|uniref:S41 family peptidase n=1 Tax=Rhodanobacter sp. DHG33 TaxID=2775921 RepID=UPI00177CF432|nr:S41 family peptidase [Rhodanobacter sp. DHG33]MBD8900290.1 S41 family peptidase [Rhodanobacter sp. DHG33]
MPSQAASVGRRRNHLEGSEMNKKRKIAIAAAVGISALSSIAVRAWVGRPDAGPPHEPPQKDMAIDKAMRSEVIDNIIANLDRAYVFPDKAAVIGADLRSRLSHGDFDAIGSAEKFADTLTGVLQDQTHDKHLEVRYFEQAVAEGRDGGPSPEEQADEALHQKQLNYGFANVGRLHFNIGLLDLHAFSRPQPAAGRIAAAMTLLGDTDALIIDLRQCQGGDPDTVMLLASYLFDKPTHLNDIYFRDENRTQERWTTASVPGKRYGQARPVYLLTSNDTISGCEDFAYALKNAGRAKLVGETTAGAAHAGAPHRLSAHFMMFVPSGRPINPVTHGDWEGVGVVPDIKTSAGKALDAAQLTILRKMLSSETDPMRKDDMQKHIDALK